MTAFMAMIWNQTFASMNSYSKDINGLYKLTPEEINEKGQIFSHRETKQ